MQTQKIAQRKSARDENIPQIATNTKHMFFLTSTKIHCEDLNRHIIEKGKVSNDDDEHKREQQKTNFEKP